MRTIICAYLLLFTGILNLNAQEYKPLVVEGAWWFYTTYELEGSDVTTYHFINIFEGDTIIDGNVFKKLNGCLNGSLTGCFQAAYREVDKVVTIYADNEEHVVYNFNWEIGDEIIGTYYDYYFDFSYSGYNVISDTCSLMLQNGETVLQSSLWDSIVDHCDTGGIEYSVCERVGNLRGGLLQPFGVIPSISGSITNLHAFGVGDTVLYNVVGDYQFLQDIIGYDPVETISHIDILVSPNPTSQYLNIDNKTGVKQSIIYNINGQKVLQTDTATQLNVSQLKPGRYIAQIQLIDGTISSQHFVKQ